MTNILFKKLVVSLELLFVFTCLAITSPPAQSRPIAPAPDKIMIDPIFSVEYQPSKVSFGKLDPNILMPACKKVLSSMYGPLPKMFTLYAEYEKNEVSIYIVGNEVVLGIFAVRKGICEGGAPELSMYQLYSPPPHSPGCPVLGDAEVAGLFEDALIRYEKAFGGKDRFLKWLDDATSWMRSSCAGLSSDLCQTPYDSFQPFRKELLSHYRNQKIRN